MVSHTYPSGTDLTGSPSHSAYWRDQILPAIQGRLEPQIYATSGDLPASGDYVGQRALVGSGVTMAEYVYDGTAWKLWTSGWQDITVTSPGTGSPSPKCRMVGGVPAFRGVITRALTVNVATVIGTVPVAFRPAAEDYTYRMLVNVNSPSQPVFGFIAADGQIIVYATATGTPPVALSGLAGYSID